MSGRPGWYRDPTDPARFRHWDGRRWSGRHRGWPGWDLHAVDLDPDLELDTGGPVAEGPVRPAPLPAAAARAGLADGATVAWLQRPGPGRARPGAPSRRSGGRPPAHATSWAPSRTPMLVFCLLVATAIAVMTVSVTLAGPRAATVGAVETDVAFVRAAGTACGQGLAPLRHSEAMSSGPATPAQLATVATGDATAVSATATALAQLPVRADAADAVHRWLGTWATYAADERALAAAETGATPASRGAAAPAAGSPSSATPAGTPGTTRTPTAASPGAGTLAGRVADDVISADQFAVANGLSACRLGTDPAAGEINIP